MLVEHPEGKWVACFERNFAACGIGAGTVAAILSETQSRPVNVELARQALARLGAQAFHVEMITPALRNEVAVRSTGASVAIQGMAPVIAALSQCEVVIDCTVEGVIHSPEVPQLMKQGLRWLMVSNEHPEVFERLGIDPGLEERVRAGLAMVKAAETMRVTSPVGTMLEIRLGGCPTGGNWGYCRQPGTRSHWPGGLIASFPNAGSVSGRVAFGPGDANLTFKRYFESRVVLEIENDFVVDIGGESLDAELMRSYFAAWGDRNAYAVSHVGWGMNRRARWDSLAMYDRKDVNGTELRVFAGNFLFSTGANEHAGRFTEGHFDLPMRNCTIELDGRPIVENGVLKGALA